MSEFSNMVIKLLQGGANPNELATEFEKTVSESGCDWALWGDMRWREDTVCSICGSAYAGVCGHKDYYARKVIPRSEYERQRGLGK